MKLILAVTLSICLLFSCCVSALIYNPPVTATATNELTKPIIVIDAGHGGEDGGATSETGLLEKDVNLHIALILQKLFLQSGFEVTMTRTEDKAIYNNDAISLREKKVSDIHNRSEIINQSADNILISIHQNKFEQRKYSGTQIFYSDNNSFSRQLAENIRLSVTGLLQNNNTRQTKASTDDIYILKKANVPAVLVECGFLSNPQEEELLKIEMYRNQLAFAIFSGFIEFYYQYY